MARDYEVVVIGGGPAGYVAAIRLAQLGKRTLCIEREYWGGVCLNWGCIPSKALIEAAHQWERLQLMSSMGISVRGAELDFGQTQRWKDEIVGRLTGGVERLLSANGVDTLEGAARLASAHEVDVQLRSGGTARVRTSEGIVIATGAEVISVPGLEADGERIVTAREAVSLVEVPESLAVIGGGIIGMELGMMYQRLGSRVTIVELTDRLLPGVDSDLVGVVERRFRKRGGQLLTEARALGWQPSGERAVLRIDHEGETKALEADRILVAVGFKPNAQGLGLEEVGVALDPRGHIVIDDQFRSSVPSIFAIGDVAGPPYLAHKSFREAELVAEVIGGKHASRAWLALPSAIFTDPEIAVVGMSEAEARTLGVELEIGRFPFAASGRARSHGETDGFVKVISDRDRVLGVGIVGPQASELIGEATFGIEMMASAEDFAMTIHPHPTLSEGLMEAFKHAVGEAAHVLNRSRREVLTPDSQLVAVS